MLLLLYHLGVSGDARGHKLCLYGCVVYKKPLSVHYARSVAVVDTERAGCAEKERRESVQKWWRALGHAPVRRLATTLVTQQSTDPINACKIRQCIKQGVAHHHHGIETTHAMDKASSSALKRPK